ncbi:MAG: S41 family peptidase [Candidatus Taylorbacteria bacterium]|nr:S41 family peptidase [Candidatus Taylorbacteria bacterium]
MNSKLRENAALIVVALLILGGTFYTGVKFGAAQAPDAILISELSGKEEGMPDEVDFSPFWKVWSLIDEKFVPKGTTTTPTQERVWGAIEGLSASLDDPFTMFLPPEINKMFESEISGSFEGVGMEIGNKDGKVVVIAPLKGTPAYRAGIEPGDYILEINGASTEGMPSDKAVRLIRGKKGTVVTLLVERGVKEPFELKVTRDKIAIPTIDTEIKTTTSNGTTTSESATGLRKDGVFVIKLYNFSEPSPVLFQDALRKFIDSGSQKLLLDLRGNPGGYLSAAIDMASWFLPAGDVIVRENFGDKQPEVIHRSIGRDIFNRNLKMIILVNGGSASASEILAGALQEHGVAKLVGTSTFGKGSVQELVKITPDTSFKVTIAKWLTPTGRSISDGGLTPDYKVEYTEKDKAAGRDPQMDKAVQLLQ